MEKVPPEENVEQWLKDSQGNIEIKDRNSKLELDINIID